MTEWHKKIKNEIARKLEEKGYFIEKDKCCNYKEGSLGLDKPVTLSNRFKKVDILATKTDEILIVEIEDMKNRKGEEVGVSFTELGGIMLLGAIIAKESSQKVFIQIVFRTNIKLERQEKIEQIVAKSQDILNFLIIEIKYMD